jgi:hypothetical protein
MPHRRHNPCRLRRAVKRFRANGRAVCQCDGASNRSGCLARRTIMIATFLIVLSVLAVAVIGRAALDPQH